jgi:hypothetical protein
LKVEYGVLRVLMDRAEYRPHPAAMEFWTSRDGGDVQVDKVSVDIPGSGSSSSSGLGQ